MMWDDRMPMWQDEWQRHCEFVLGYCGSPENTSVGGLSASGLWLTTGNWNLRKWKLDQGDYCKSVFGVSWSSEY